MMFHDNFHVDLFFGLENHVWRGFRGKSGALIHKEQIFREFPLCMVAVKRKSVITDIFLPI